MTRMQPDDHIQWIKVRARADRSYRQFIALTQRDYRPVPRDWWYTRLDDKPKRRQYQHRPRPPADLLTSAQAAAKLNCSIKTLTGHVRAGELKYVTMGHGRKRPRRRFTVADLNEFIVNQTREDIPCPSSRICVHHTGGLTSSSKVIAFTAAPKPQSGVKPKK